MYLAKWNVLKFVGKKYAWYIPFRSLEHIANMIMVFSKKQNQTLSASPRHDVA
jgi:hypothetical protein